MHLKIYQNVINKSIERMPPVLPAVVPSPLGGGRQATSGGGSVSAPLGLYTKSQNTQKSLIDEKVRRRLEKFELQAVASSILRPYLVRDKTGNLQIPRVCKCLNVRRKKHVEVWQSAKTNLAYYGGLVVCGSVWDCLPCAGKISEERSDEIRQAVEVWEGLGNTVIMLTQTFPHYSKQKCKELRLKFGKARIHQKNSRSWKSLKKQKCLVGEIYRVEVTVGQNGWHIHSHALLFLQGKQSLTNEDFYHTWSSACVASGLPSPSKAHGVSISTPKQKADYIAKQGKETSNWTLEAEMTKGHIKRGGREGLTPFDLLRAYRDTNEQHYADMFHEYSKTFKGTRQLVWSPGLRKRLGLKKELTDQEAAENVDQLDKLFSMIPSKLWEFIRKSDQRKNFRGKLLEALNQSEGKFIEALQVLQTCAGYTELPF